MAPPARGESQQRRQVVGEDMENNFPNFEIKVPKSRSVSRGPPTPPRYDEHLKKLKQMNDSIKNTELALKVAGVQPSSSGNKSSFVRDSGAKDDEDIKEQTFGGVGIEIYEGPKNMRRTWDHEQLGAELRRARESGIGLEVGPIDERQEEDEETEEHYDTFKREKEKKKHQLERMYIDQKKEPTEQYFSKSGQPPHSPGENYSN